VVHRPKTIHLSEQKGQRNPMSTVGWSLRGTPNCCAQAGHGSGGPRETLGSAKGSRALACPSWQAPQRLEASYRWEALIERLAPTVLDCSEISRSNQDRAKILSPPRFDTHNPHHPPVKGESIASRRHKRHHEATLGVRSAPSLRDRLI
jgi:hypothetical protein